MGNEIYMIEIEIFEIENEKINIEQQKELNVHEILNWYCINNAIFT